MTAIEIKQQVDADPTLEVVGADVDAQEIAICHTPERGVSIVCVVHLERAQPDMTWAELEPVIKGTRRARCLRHMTRIVGYWSALENWVSSKLAELDDRHRGDYGV